MPEGRKIYFGMIHLINALMHQQYGLVIWPQQTGGKRPLSERHGASLDAEAHVDSGFYLRFCNWGSRREEVWCDGACCFGGEGCFEGHVDRDEEASCVEGGLLSGLVGEERVAIGSVPATDS
jgi:hypothetical protein